MEELSQVLGARVARGVDVRPEVVPAYGVTYRHHLPAVQCLKVLPQIFVECSHCGDSISLVLPGTEHYDLISPEQAADIFRGRGWTVTHHEARCPQHPEL